MANYYLVTIKKDSKQVFSAVFMKWDEALEWLSKGFEASLDDSANVGTEFSIREEEAP